MQNGICQELKLAEVVILRFDSESGTEFIQFYSCGKTKTGWTAVGFEGKSCGSGVIPISIDEVSALTRYSQRALQGELLNGVELVILGNEATKLRTSRAELEKFFRHKAIVDVAWELNRHTKKADRIRYIPDVALQGIVETKQLPIDKPSAK